MYKIYGHMWETDSIMMAEAWELREKYHRSETNVKRRGSLSKVKLANLLYSILCQ